MKLQFRTHHLKMRHKFAALGMVAVAMVATPLVQVLRYQSAELQAALYEQAGLDPVSGAVTLQHALLAHRDIAGLVLRGVLQLEPERTVRQAEVEDRSATLESTLFTLKLPRAVGEVQALRQDWVTLVPQVEQRRINASDSDAAHRLLVEQTLQVMDLVADASGLDSHGTGTRYLASVRDLAQLPRLTAQLAALGLPADSGAERGDLAAAEAALARMLGHLSEGLQRGALTDPALAGAVATAGVTADKLFQLRRLAEPAGAPALAATAAAAVQAQARLFDVASHSVRSALVARAARAQQARVRLCVLMGSLAVLALGLVLALRRHLGAAHPEDPGSPGVGIDGAADGQTLHRDVSGRLWQRLRLDSTPELPATTPPAAATDPPSLVNKDIRR